MLRTRVNLRQETSLTELVLWSDSGETAETHIIFVHGLSGHITGTWSTSDIPPILWPKWLAEDLPHTSVWGMGYDSAKSNWFGTSLPISDLAENLLQHLPLEPRLSSGRIIFVGHSQGGLVIEWMLRTAEREAKSNPTIEDLLNRIRRVAFLGTPHRGLLLAGLGNALRPFARPSNASRDLTPDNAGLRALNHWYRAFSSDHAMENLVLIEGKPERPFGIPLPEFVAKVVQPGSADPGLPDLPITIQADHSTISKPENRESLIYKLLRKFVEKPFSGGPRKLRMAQALDDNTNSIKRTTTELRALRDESRETASTVEQIARSVAENIAKASTTDLIDTEVDRQLDVIRRLRLFGDFDTEGEARSLARSLTTGNLSSASAATKAEALAWCARFLSQTATDEAEQLLANLNRKIDSVKIACAFISAARGDLSAALGAFADVGTAAGRGAAYIAILRAKSSADARSWLIETSTSLADIDSDAKFFHLRDLLDEGEWKEAVEAAEQLTEEDFQRTPALLLLAADAHMLQAVPIELRTFLLQHLPLDAANFPLSVEADALEHRRKATDLYDQMRQVAAKLALPHVVSLAGDKSLWLRLKNPQLRGAAKDELTESIKDLTELLRRLPLALQFGVEVDLERVESEVDRQTALTGGSSPDAGGARFSLAFTKPTPEERVAYIDKNREELTRHIDWKGLTFFELEMLAASGQTARAEQLLAEARKKGLTSREEAALERQIAEAKGGDPLESRLAAYRESGSLTDLRVLIMALEEGENWALIAEYGKKLFEVTGDASDAARLADALYQQEKLDEVLTLLDEVPALVGQSSNFRFLRAQCLYEIGRLSEAKAALDQIRGERDSANARQLEINIAVVSGDWESLQGFVEAEWSSRSDRTAKDLLRAGHIAQRIGSPRSKDLVREAANKAPDDPVILINCYSAASEAGWESSQEVFEWMERAATLSGESGPVQKMTMEDLIARGPAWSERETNIWDMLGNGEVPIFTAAQVLHRTLLSMFLLPALANMDEVDARQRPFVYAFSGARGRSEIEATTLAMDATALLTAEFLGILDTYLANYSLAIPHSLLGWLLEEKAKTLFHQPSRVTIAKELKQMLSDEVLRPFAGSALPPESLVREVGESLAALLAEASSGSDGPQRLVVRGGPVHKVGSLMTEEANLTSYDAVLCSSHDVVNKLFEKGQLTSAEAEAARAGLRPREIPWPSAKPIEDGAILYLDDLAVSHLQFLGLLGKLKRAGVNAVVSPSEKAEAESLIAFDRMTADVASVVERLRAKIRDGLIVGTIRLTQAIRVGDEESFESAVGHPTMALLKSMGEAQVAIVDDRFVNQHPRITSAAKTKPLLSSIDGLDLLVSKQAITAEDRQEALTKLRRANFIFVPVTATELGMLLANATAKDGVLVETAELRAIRENAQRIRMSKALQIPKEIQWLAGLGTACLFALKDIWVDGVDVQAAQARSDWLVDLSDPAGWTHRFAETSAELAERFQHWAATLMVLPAIQPDGVRDAYWDWFDRRLLKLIQTEDPETYAALLERARAMVAQGVAATSDDLEEEDE